MAGFAPPPAAKAALEEGSAFTPRFDVAGLVTCVTVERATGAVLMVAFMNADALRLTLDTGVVHYWSRSRNALWRKGDTSGQVQRLVACRVLSGLNGSSEVRGSPVGTLCPTGAVRNRQRSSLAQA